MFVYDVSSRKNLALPVIFLFVRSPRSESKVKQMTATFCEEKKFSPSGICVSGKTFR